MKASGSRIFRQPTLFTEGDKIPDPAVDAFRPSLARLRTLPVLHDGDPSKPKLDPNSEDWDDGTEITAPLAQKVAAVPARETKLILIDCNVLIVNSSTVHLRIPWCSLQLRTEMVPFRKFLLHSFLRRDTSTLHWSFCVSLLSTKFSVVLMVFPWTR